jgi:hypothetical protein
MSEQPDNVIQIPTSAGEGEETQEAPKQSSQELVLQLIEKNRKKGLETLDRKLDNLDDRGTLSDAAVESAVRNLTAGLKGSMTILEALNSLVDFIKHDLISTIQNLERQGQAQFQASAHLQALISLLKEREMITDDELRDSWNKLVQEAKEEGAKPTD